MTEATFLKFTTTPKICQKLTYILKTLREKKKGSLSSPSILGLLFLICVLPNDNPMLLFYLLIHLFLLNYLFTYFSVMTLSKHTYNFIRPYMLAQLVVAQCTLRNVISGCSIAVLALSSCSREYNGDD